MTSDLASIGLAHNSWQEAVEAAINTDRLAVIGEVRGGQLIQFTDPSGSQITILGVEPYATFASFSAETQANAHLFMVDDVVCFADIIDDDGNHLGSATMNLAQGPLLVDEPTQSWQPLGITALALDVHPTKDPKGTVDSPGAGLINANSGEASPDAAATVSLRLLDPEVRTAALTGQRFLHARVEVPFPIEVCLPAPDEGAELPTAIEGRVLLTAQIAAPPSCGGGGCGCVGH